MSTTTENPNLHTALIVIDLQAGTLRNFPRSTFEPVVANASVLAAGFRRHQLPVVITTVDGTPTKRSANTPVAPWEDELTAVQPELELSPTDITHRRRSWSAFAGGSLDLRLSELGVTKVVLAGVATGFGVESTARAAADLGYDIVFSTDAIADFRTDAHTASMEMSFPALGQLATTAEIIQQLDTP